MNKLEEAIIYATIMHQGAKRKMSGAPYILHPLEVSEILATMTDDTDILTAGVLHDIVEDTDGSMHEIEKRFGPRVAQLIAGDSEDKHPEMNPEDSWKMRKEQSISELRNTTDVGIKMIWLADKLSNIRTIANIYGEKGNAVWQEFHQKDTMQHRWYYTTIAELLESDLNKTGAYKEYIKHINYIWPGSFDDQKTYFKKYKQISVEGCKLIGRGAKGEVYKYDDDFIVKVYNGSNTYREIERENALAKKAFFADIPTAISFGIVSVGNRFGSMFELINANSISEIIARDISTLPYYAKLMADLAKKIHNVSASELELDSSLYQVRSWISEGIAKVDVGIAETISKYTDELEGADNVIHGDFHTGNVMMQSGEPIIIDMDGLSGCHPIVELCGVYMSYVGFGELDKTNVESFMGFSYEWAKGFFELFMQEYFNDRDDNYIQIVTDKVALLCYVRLVKRCYREGNNLSKENAKARDYYMERIKELLTKVDSFTF